MSEPSKDHEAPDSALAMAAASDAIISRDLEGRITAWGPGAERMFGYSATEMLGASILQLIPPDLHDDELQILVRIRRGERVEPVETVRQTKDGGMLDLWIALSPVRNPEGEIVGAMDVARDITELKRREREIVRLSRLYAALSRINLSIISSPSPDALFKTVCQVLVEQGGFRMAWIGWPDPDTRRLAPIASHGDWGCYLESVNVPTEDGPQGRGPAGIAFEQGRRYICNDIMQDPATRPWRAQMRAQGWRASAAFPIRLAGETRAVLSVYADQSGFFQDKEIALLTETAADIAFALDNFARDDARRLAEQRMRHERDFSDAVINSMPGVLYLYDRDGRFLRWNRNFEQATGYGADEIRTMRPADFFAGPEKALIGSRIAEVFDRGSASVEASLLAKDGRTTPYVFTGVKTEIGGRECLVGVGINISQRKQAQGAQQAAEDRMRQAQSELARVARVSLLGEFAASLAHEINQPLAAVSANGGAALRWLARQPPNLDQATEAIGRIVRDAARAGDVVKRMRAWVTKAAPEHVDLDLNRIVNEVVQFTAAELRAAEVVVITDLAEGLPPVRGDRIQLQQVVLNLIVNAIDAMKSAADRPRTLRVRTALAEPDHVLVEVEDCGVGIDPAEADRLFEPFFTTKAGGTGLGLAISRTIVEGHGGRLRASPAVPHGAVFRFTLPAIMGSA